MQRCTMVLIYTEEGRASAQVSESRIKKLNKGAEINGM